MQNKIKENVRKSFFFKKNQENTRKSKAHLRTSSEKQRYSKERRVRTKIQGTPRKREK